MNTLKKIFERVDRQLIQLMSSLGHTLECWVLGVLFMWFGLLKVFGYTSASSIIAKSVYWFDAELVVPTLGYWEFAIGLFLLIPAFRRVAILLLIVRVPGTFLALIYHYSECFESSIFLPSIQGQYLLKELTLIGAALVIGGSFQKEAHSSE